MKISLLLPPGSFSTFACNDTHVVDTVSAGGLAVTWFVLSIAPLVFVFMSISFPSRSAWLVVMTLSAGPEPALIS